MATWEFTSEHSSSYDIDGLVVKLNERAADGWDVVTIIPTGGDVTAFFRREKAKAMAQTTPAVEKEAAPVAGGLGSLAGGASTASLLEAKKEEAEAKAEGEKPLVPVGAAGEEESTTAALFAEAEPTTKTPESVKEPSGWAVAPDVSKPSTPEPTPSTTTSPWAPTSTVTTGDTTTPSAATPSAAASTVEPMAPIGAESTPGATTIPGATTTAPGTPAAAAPGTPGTPGTPGAATPSTPSPAAPTPAPVVTTPAGWYPDPSGRFEMRYWDGHQWTEYVSRAGQQYTDPPVA